MTEINELDMTVENVYQPQEWHYPGSHDQSYSLPSNIPSWLPLVRRQLFLAWMSTMLGQPVLQGDDRDKEVDSEPAADEEAQAPVAGISPMQLPSPSRTTLEEDAEAIIKP